jgi:hypothetical protein
VRRRLSRVFHESTSKIPMRRRTRRQRPGLSGRVVSDGFEARAFVLGEDLYGQETCRKGPRGWRRPKRRSRVARVQRRCL